MKMMANGAVAVTQDSGVLIKSTADALDLMADAVHLHGCGGVALDRASFAPAYFDLSTGLLGDMLQKYTNYRFKIAIYGCFDDIASESLKAFMIESNRKGDQVLFVEDKAEAIRMLNELLAKA